MRHPLLALVLLAIALLSPSSAARGQDDARTLLVLAIDDRAGLGFAAPEIALDLPGEEARPMVDDGTRKGDQPGDGIWMFTAPVPAGQMVGVRVIDGDRVIAALELAVPDGERAFFAYKVLDDGTLVPDPAARPVEGVGDPILPQGSEIGQARSLDGAGAGAERQLGDDEVLVRISLDDRAVRRLHHPQVEVSGQGSQAVALTDDGSVPGDTPADRIHVGELVVQRTQYLGLLVRDGDEELGELTVFLPSTGQAAVSIRTTEGDPGVELAVEPTASGANEGPGSGGASTSGGGGDRLAHVMWVAVALFAIAFAWLRSVAWRAWTEEVRPVLRKLDRWLDEELGRRQQGGER